MPRALDPVSWTRIDPPEMESALWGSLPPFVHMVTVGGDNRGEQGRHTKDPAHCGCPVLVLSCTAYSSGLCCGKLM